MKYRQETYVECRVRGHMDRVFFISRISKDTERSSQGIAENGQLLLLILPKEVVILHLP